MKFSLFLVSIVLILSACNKVDFNKLSDSPWNPQLGAPLLNAEFSVEDIISKMDSNGNVGFLNNVVTLSYSTTLDTISIANLLKIKPVDVDYSIYFPVESNYVNKTITVGEQLPPFTSNHNFNLDFGSDNNINKIEFKSGELVLAFSTSIKQEFKFNIEIPTLQKNNKFFSTQSRIPYNNLSENSVVVKVPLAGYTAELGDEINPTKDFKINITTTLIGSGQKIAATNLINLNLSLKEFGISYAEGKFGEFTKNLKDSVDINLIKNATSGEFGLTNPRIKFSVENSFGFPIEIKIDSITSKEKNITSLPVDIITNKTLIKSNGIDYRDQKASIDKILISKSSINEVGYTNLQVDKIDQLINSREKTLRYLISTKVTQNNTKAFITDKSYLIIKATAELPLEGYASNFEINDTLDFKIDDSEELILDYLEIKLLAINKFPLDVKGSLLLLDENKSIIRNSLNQPFDLLNLKNQNVDLTNVLNAGKTDANGNVIEGSTTALTFLITKENMNNFKKAKFIKIIGKLNVGSSAKPIKLTESNSLKLQLGIKTSVKPTFK
jgi:hypothetical protein